MIDFVIRGDQVVTPWGVGSWDVAVQGEKIVAVAEQGTLAAEAGCVIDASGKIVVPGGIEPHAHIGAPIATRPGVETSPPEQVSRAALFGGTTTLTDFARALPGTDIFQSIEERTSRWKGNSYCDYSHHCMLIGKVPPMVLGQMQEAIQDGLPTFKVFTTTIQPTARIPENERRTVDMGHLSAVMEQSVAHGGMIFVHSEDDDILQYMYNKLAEEERSEWYNIPEVHSSMSEDLSFRRVMRVAEWMEAAVYFVHLSAKEGVDAVREARGKGLPIYGETLHNYCCFTADAYREPDGMKYHTSPSLRGLDDQQMLWDGLIKGGISSMATDEYCTDLDLKLSGRTVHDIKGGHAGAETRMGITFSEGVVKRGMSLQRFVDVTSSNAARIMGYYPRKGAIATGSDADIVLIDPKVRKTLSLDDLHIGDYSIWEGWEVSGWPATTILRGKVVVDDGQFHGKLGDGKFIPRKISREILSRPAC